MPFIGPYLARIFFLPSYGYTQLLSNLGFRKSYDRIDETVYMGVLPTVTLQKYLIEHEKINAVISMNEEYELGLVSDQSLWTRHKIEHLRLPTVDFSNPQVQNLMVGVKFLRSVRENNRRAYVHCKAGRQRSASLVACYVIDTYDMTPEEAVQYICSIRSCAIFGKREIKRLYEFVACLRDEHKRE